MGMDLKKDIISRLQKDILLMEGFKPATANSLHIPGLEMVMNAFPNNIFPTGTIHEFLSYEPEQAAAAGSFISGILSILMKKGGACLWIGVQPQVFPPALKQFGVIPHHIIFICVREKEVLWVMEEALKCKGLAAVIAEVQELNFMQSRRLQLTTEGSDVTGFVLRSNPKKLCTTACMARWQVMPIASNGIHDMPGVGFPRWQVELLKVRNGKTGSWQVEWLADRFAPVISQEDKMVRTMPVRKVS
jgi:protein ImuA